MSKHDELREDLIAAIKYLSEYEPWSNKSPEMAKELSKLAEGECYGNWEVNWLILQLEKKWTFEKKK